ncbi:hypothetical protein WMY93_000048 [Mugilogobius chulae]|uniref:Uncharacterized protein n=1 Tax=Mugilogobius chulae TaxID=88201 RepID=A0AAW0Q8Y2_9GOBI
MCLGGERESLYAEDGGKETRKSRMMKYIYWWKRKERVDARRLREKKVREGERRGQRGRERERGEETGRQLCRKKKEKGRAWEREKEKLRERVCKRKEKRKQWPSEERKRAGKSKGDGKKRREKKQRKGRIRVGVTASSHRLKSLQDRLWSQWLDSNCSREREKGGCREEREVRGGVGSGRDDGVL